MTITLVRESTVELIKTNATDEDVAFAAWVSNFASDARNKSTDRIAGLIKFLYANQHMSPFEHGSFTYFVDTPIFVAREFMRHRTFSYNETSGRYKELEPRFYIPTTERPLVQVGKIGAYKHMPGNKEQFALMHQTQRKLFEAAWEAYQTQLNAGIAREVARNVLPLATMTQFYATANPRNVMQYLLLREDEQALYEIRAVANIIKTMFADAMPLTFKAFQDRRDFWAKVTEIFDTLDIDEVLEYARNKQSEKTELYL